jgi:hypothetical protein
MKTTRRTLLSAATLAPLAALPASAAANPDGALIAACGEALAIAAAREAIPYDRDDLMDAACCRLGDAVEVVLELPLPVTPAGRQAYARLALATAPRSNHGEVLWENTCDFMAWQIVSHVAGVAS